MPQLRDSGNSRSMPVGDRRLRVNRFARIFGIETEYGVSVTGADHSCSAGAAAAAMFRPVVSRSRSTNTYLPNGSRLYLDVGSHPEYATAEARDPLTAVTQDLAGERMMRRLALHAQERLRESYGPNATVHLFKNNVDSAGHSFGCHENYLVRRCVPLHAIERQLLPFLVTRQLFCGAGRLSGRGFEITQRADFLDESISSATTRARPLVNTRDEPHADPEQYRRLHIIIGDSNRSQTVSMLKLATTHLVLCVIEQSIRSGEPSGLESCALANPSDANRVISHDMSLGHVPLQLVDPEGIGRHQQNFSALDIQYHYADVVRRFLERYGQEMAEAMPRVDPQQVLHAWVEDLDRISSGDWQVLSSSVDWVMKRRLIKAFSRRHPGACDDRLAQIDMDYHDVANGSAYEALLRHGAMRELVPAHDAELALARPPQDTRAALRGAFITKALQRGVHFSCDWTRLTLDGHDEGHAAGEEAQPGRLEAVLLDPFGVEAGEDYQRIMRYLES
ncbi:proteasome accessory factor PafA2 family protein [Bifidobacterium sp.]|jgi:proteasome accessory factor A|uniref:proteasome accessory factor PafA2 family protein n=1 Tax=Bifidobacterium sp. TaxID=41200 RepID=UPI0025C5E129|nr:proteasome accessory factor PafA2 family protein [Bifidobacterium sp.]MCH4208677.1 proteasome accessory factor PafA2 family protein [Bifidobacterium sp.]MCI1224351.1 proteasome accessory factor PafA2 family protein [Bifidobacterium sp.]